MENWLTKWFANESVNLLEAVLPTEFYSRHTVKVAKDLLGKILVVRSQLCFPLDDPRSGTTAGKIVETEAYRAEDPASHSARGMTRRSSVMFGNPGAAYVYLIYGMYEMLNFVTEPNGKPGAVLIRAVEPLWGLDLMRMRRKLTGIATGDSLRLTRGPGLLCEAMGVFRYHNSASLSGPALFVLDDGTRPVTIARSPRIGIKRGTDRLWRFFIEGNRFVSPMRPLAGG